MSAGPQQSGEGKEEKKDRVCDFYLTPRGCRKGDQCDFQHPPPSSGISAGQPPKKMCEFFLSPKGCRKGESCDFLHQARPPVKPKICTFYMTPQGCIKGLNCDFLHPKPGMFGDLPMAQLASLVPGLAAAQAPVGQVPGTKSKPCDFFLSPRGCIKGESCDFAHIRQGDYFPGATPGWPAGVAADPFAAAALGLQQRPAERKKPKPCEFFNTARGCVKGELCDFVHQKNKVCEFFNKPGGCRKGAFCDFKHAESDGSSATPVADGASGDAASGKVKPKRGSDRYTPY